VLWREQATAFKDGRADLEIFAGPAPVLLCRDRSGDFDFERTSALIFMHQCVFDFDDGIKASRERCSGHDFPGAFLCGSPGRRIWQQIWQRIRRAVASGNTAEDFQSTRAGQGAGVDRKAIHRGIIKRWYELATQQFFSANAADGVEKGNPLDREGASLSDSAKLRERIHILMHDRPRVACGARAANAE
jgi:hypothetical protein